MKSYKEINKIMQTIPQGWRTHWCGGERDPCACLGCVQIGNRLIMTGLKVTQIDPEHIDERSIPPEIYEKYKITKKEWQDWMNSNWPPKEVGK